MLSSTLTQVVDTASLAYGGKQRPNPCRMVVLFPDFSVQIPQQLEPLITDITVVGVVIQESLNALHEVSHDEVIERKPFIAFAYESRTRYSPSIGHLV